jgi:hypothetical protein
MRLRAKAQERVADDRMSFLDQIEAQIHALERARERQAFKHTIVSGSASLSRLGREKAPGKPRKANRRFKVITGGRRD